MQLLVRALRVLQALSREPRGLVMSEVASQAELPLATAHRILTVLEAEGFVTRATSNRRYFIGPASRELSHTDIVRESPLITPHEAVAQAGKLTGETVFLSELVGSGVVCLALAQSRYPLRLSVKVGQEMPLHAAASARVLLAGLSADEVRSLLRKRGPLVTFTKDTPSTVEQVLDRLALIRTRGYDISHDELDDNVWAIAAPVRSSTDEVLASITLAAPMQRMGEESTRDAAIKVILEAADEMSVDLGWQGRSTDPPSA
jgi:DNA-binding IclR family transcriptional regulator